MPPSITTVESVATTGASDASSDGSGRLTNQSRQSISNSGSATSVMSASHHQTRPCT